MSTAQNPLTTSVVQRPVGLRMRQDLICAARLVAGQRRYVIKDPVTLAHHQLWEEEYVLLQMLDGRNSFASMKAQFEQRFHPARLDYRLLELLHGQFYQHGLVLSDYAGQGASLLERAQAQRRRLGWGRLRNLLAIRFRGINPDRLLAYLNSRIGFCFSPLVVALCTVAMLLTAAFMITAQPMASWQMRELAAYLTPASLVWLGLAYLGLKIVHELGHGLACKRLGGECSELGIMLLVFTPCLYCDVSDSWIIGDRWKRAAVAAAGMWCELLVAMLAAWLWWFSQPGLLHSLSFHVMCLGSLGTILFNANPLLRYDGYFVLSDVLDIPNLWQQARGSLAVAVRRLFWGTPPGGDAALPQTPLPGLWLYALASGFYRGIVAVVILTFVFEVLRAWRLELVAQGLIAGSLGMLILSGWQAGRRFLGSPRRPRRWRRGRVAVSVCVLLALGGSVCWLPLPASLRVPVLIHFANSQPVVAVIDGQLVECVPEGSYVEQGETVARLESPLLKLELLARQGDLARHRARLDGLEARRSRDESVSSQIPSVREAIAGLELEVERLDLAVEQLTLRAPCSGIVLASTSRLAQFDPSDIEPWTGNVLQPENLGCTVLRGTPICEVGQPPRIEARAYVTQSQIELLAPGFASSLKIHQHPDRKLEGQLVEVGSDAQRDLPAEVLRGGWFPMRHEPNQSPQPAEPLYVARLVFPESPPAVIPQVQGWASIRLPPQTLAQRLWRLFHQTFGV